MSKLAQFTQAKQLSVDDYVALAAKAKAELDADGRTCEVADVCRAASGLVHKTCGFVNAGTVRGCPKRKRYSGRKPHKSGYLMAIEDRP